MPCLVYTTLCKSNQPSPSSSGDLRAVLKNLVWRKSWTRLKSHFLPVPPAALSITVQAGACGSAQTLCDYCRPIPSTFFKFLCKTTLKLGDTQGRDLFSHYFESLKWMGDKWIYTFIFPVVIRSSYMTTSVSKLWLLLPAWKQIPGIISSHVLESRAILFEIKGNRYY